MLCWRVLGVLGLVLSASAPAAAQERVSLSEIVPVLAGTELGTIDLGPAPAPGAVRVVHRAEIVAALRAAGRNTRGLSIPRTTRIRRESVHLSENEIARRAGDAVSATLSPCEVRSIRVRSDATVAEGEIAFSADGPERPSGHQVMVHIVMTSQGRRTRVPAQVEIQCPEPVVRAGGRVRVTIVMGNVHASADGIARQPGRVGDTIRVHIETTHAMVQARIVDSQRVEIIR